MAVRAPPTTLERFVPFRGGVRFVCSIVRCDPYLSFKISFWVSNASPEFSIFLLIAEFENERSFVRTFLESPEHRFSRNLCRYQFRMNHLFSLVGQEAKEECLVFWVGRAFGDGFGYQEKVLLERFELERFEAEKTATCDRSKGHFCKQLNSSASDQAPPKRVSNLSIPPTPN